MSFLKHLVRVCVFAAAIGPSVCLAQTFPWKPITIYVGLPPGGVSDWQARAFGDQLTRRMGQPVVVEHRPGAGSLMAIQALKSAQADGHALMTTTNVAGLSSLFVQNASSDAGRDFMPVGAVFWAPYVMVTNAKVPAKSIGEFVAHARANPGKLNWAVVPNNAIHLDTLDLIRAMNVNIQVVPYKGAAPAHLALLANEVQVYMAGGFFGFSEAVQKGQLTILALASAKSVPQLPGVPTLKAALGLNVDRKVDYGFATSPGTPKATIDRLSRELGSIAMGDLSDEIRKRGYEPEALSADEFLQVMRDEYVRGKAIAESNGIKPQ